MTGSCRGQERNFLIAEVALTRTGSSAKRNAYFYGSRRQRINDTEGKETGGRGQEKSEDERG